MKGLAERPRGIVPVLILAAVLVLAGCTQKFAKITLEEGATLTVNGNIDPSFLRENTKESITPDLDFSIPVVPQ